MNLYSIMALASLGFIVISAQCVIYCEGFCLRIQKRLYVPIRLKIYIFVSL